MLVLAEKGNTLTLAEQRESTNLSTPIGADAHAIKVEHWMHTTSFSDPDGSFRNAPDIFDLAAAREEMSEKDLELEGLKEEEVKEVDPHQFDAFEPVQVIDPAAAANFARLPDVMPCGCDVPAAGAMAGLANAISGTSTVAVDCAVEGAAQQPGMQKAA